MEDRLIEQGQLYEDRRSRLRQELQDREVDDVQQVPQINSKSIDILLNDVGKNKQINGKNYLTTNVEDRLLQLGEAAHFKKAQKLREYRE